ncbi:uncharacterized protein LOC119576190 [Penaeus monodon]|uniref:uncharacterized protein LOC119576190 n=1 Tax=Penaeus monodon TaxID=6687 RepID=UPI0018A7D6F7|nr:uncharacterized protein LOC119576190 [Penaeus monodon]
MKLVITLCSVLLLAAQAEKQTDDTTATSQDLRQSEPLHSQEKRSVAKLLLLKALPLLKKLPPVLPLPVPIPVPKPFPVPLPVRVNVTRSSGSKPSRSCT